MSTNSGLAKANVSEKVQPLVNELITGADKYRVAVSKTSQGVTMVDAGIDAPGGLAAGRLIGEICMGGLGAVQIAAADRQKRWWWHVDVHSGDPVTACLASQYAGWSLNHGEGKDAFYALGSGPARAMGSKEPLYEELAYRNPAGETAIVLEVDKQPPTEVVEKVVDRCGIKPEQLTMILTPTTSIAGGVQVVARVLEVALHKVHELKFPLAQIADGAGSAPVPPPSGDFMTAMGRTNDAILFGGRVHLFVDCDDEDAKNLAAELPSASSKDFGRPFGTVFKEYGYDFYKVDPMLFSPAECAVSVLKSGNTFYGGALREDLLEESFN
ncbi:MAG: methenyltetrahydromethanopterin cyclohydrolase [Pseudomonadota bacterium]